MKLIGQRKLRKLQKKNLGNRALSNAIDKLITDFEQNDIKNIEYLKKIRPDADKVHSDGFFFFNLTDHRTMVLIAFQSDESTIMWYGNHNDYETLFKNNKSTIKKWLKSKGFIK